jgi:hypothetical protein
MKQRLFRPALLVACSIALLADMGLAHAEKFTIAAISDTQNYTDVSKPQPRGIDTFIQQMQYLAETRTDKNLVFVTHVGDVVQHGNGQFRTGSAGAYREWNTHAEWDNANRAMSVLDKAGIPYGMVPGNHDYDNYAWYADPAGPGANRPLAGSAVWQEYFGPESTHFAGKTWYGGSFNNGMDSFQTFTAAGHRFLHLSLEMEPTPSALQWAQGVINTHKGLPTLITTHEWLSPNYTGDTARSNDNKAYFPGTDNQSPDQVWETFIRKNDQIFMVLAGHNWTQTVKGVSQGQNLRIDTNDAGHPVYQTVQDYQGNTIGLMGSPETDNGGAGWLRFIEFDTATQKIHYYTYSTLLGKYAGLNGENTFGIAAKYSDFELDFPPQLKF